jgi:hypothetical protein
MKSHSHTFMIMFFLVSIYIGCEESSLNQNLYQTNDATSPEGNLDMTLNDMVTMNDFESEVYDDGSHDTTPIDRGVDAIDANFQPTDSVTIEIPMRAKSEGNVKYLLVPNEARMDSESMITYEMSYPLPMVLAEGYPNRYTVHLDSPLFASICSQTEGDIEIQTIESNGITVKQLDLNSFIIEDFIVGTHTVNATGVFRPSANDLERCTDVISPTVEIKVEMSFDINIRTPTQLARSWYSCRDTSDQMMMASSSLRTIVEVNMTDDNQELISASNAERTHQIPFVITAPAGSYLEEPELGINGIRLGPAGGSFIIESPFGSPLEYSVIDTSEVTGWSIAWSIAGFAGGGIRELENNATYDGPWGRTTNRILPVITGNFISNDQALCTFSLDPNLFTLDSQTPENCIIDEQQFETTEIGGVAMGYSASLKEDGRCTLVLSAPDFNDGQGLESTMSVIVNEVEFMTAWN